MYTFAKQLTDLGISVIPLEHRSKRPNFKKLIQTGFYDEVGGKQKARWEVFQSMIAPDEVLREWFDSAEVGLAASSRPAPDWTRAGPCRRLCQRRVDLSGL